MISALWYNSKVYLLKQRKKIQLNTFYFHCYNSHYDDLKFEIRETTCATQFWSNNCMCIPKMNDIIKKILCLLYRQQRLFLLNYFIKWNKIKRSIIGMLNSLSTVMLPMENITRSRYFQLHWIRIRINSRNYFH